MNDKTLDQMSAFLDDEHAAGEEEMLLRRLASDDALRRRAGHYLLIGQALRGERRAAVSLARRLAAALDAETALEISEPPTRSRWLRPVAGVAVAASVAVVALMGLQRSGDPGATAPVTAGVETVVPAGLDAVPADFEYTVPTRSGAGPRQAAAVPARLTNYLISHGERAGTLARSGMHSRVVTHRIDFRSTQSSPDRTNEQPAESRLDESPR